MIYSLQLICSLILDSVFGDPRWFPHPVRGIGWLIEKSERIYRKFVADEKRGGLLTVITVLATTVLAVLLLLRVGFLVAPIIEELIGVVLIYIAVSTKDLLVHSNAVFDSLDLNEDITLSRQKIGMIVGRDTSRLSEEEISKACVETVAENMVDGSTAPLFYAVVASLFSPLVPLSAIGCSAVAVFAYKAINTMDSMIGYKNDQYINFGRAAARLDDVVNYIPARISGVLLVFAAFILRLDWRESFVTYRRDKNNHSSPNAGHPEAAVAGALNLRLGGPSIYFGKTVEKPYIGVGMVAPEPFHIKKANHLVVVGIALFVFGLLLLRFGFSLLTT